MALDLQPLRAKGILLAVDAAGNDIFWHPEQRRWFIIYDNDDVEAVLALPIFQHEARQSTPVVTDDESSYTPTDDIDDEDTDEEASEDADESGPGAPGIHAANLLPSPGKMNGRSCVDDDLLMFPMDWELGRLSLSDDHVHEGGIRVSCRKKRKLAELN